MLTSGQIKMARAALGWSIDVLAEKTSISSRTIKRIEKTIGWVIDQFLKAVQTKVTWEEV